MARIIKSQYENFNGTDYDVVHYETSEDLVVSNILTVPSVGEACTCDLSDNRNFVIETSGTDAKIIDFINAPTMGGIKINTSVLLKYTNECIISFPASVKWLDGAPPVFVVGKQYLISFVSYDNGVSWLSSFKGPWS